MDPKTVRPMAILARSLFRELENARYSPSEIVRFASELLELVAGEMRRARDAARRRDDARDDG